MNYTYEDIAKMIDHSLLNPMLTDKELEEGCQIALKYNVASACVMPYYLKRCAEILKGSTVKASTTIGYPHGGHTTAIKAAETKQALSDGGEELDMVVNISKVRSNDWDYVRNDIKSVLDLTHGGGKKLKVIFEIGCINDEQKIKLCKICGELGVDWVKTSTGYVGHGATTRDLKLMRKHSPSQVQVKAAGPYDESINPLDRVLEARAIGATRTGEALTIEILEECKQRLSIK